MKKIAVFTSSRADYGLLYWLLKDIREASEFDLCLIVSGSHLSPLHGNTVSQIIDDGFEIHAEIEMLLDSNTAVGNAKSSGIAIIGYADALQRLKPDCLILLGDRFEALAMAQAAMYFNIPIAHLHGGERSDGAIDDMIRHAITKLSLLHFTSTDTHKNRVIQLGEDPNRVFNVGALGVDYIKRQKLMNFNQLKSAINFDISNGYFLVTYHPVTLLDEEPNNAIKQILSALEAFPEQKVIITYPNADHGSSSIITCLEEYVTQNQARVLLVKSLGQLKYLSAMKYALAVVGNSSSGIIEAPSLHVPTINVGLRQKGRTAATSVVDVDVDAKYIVSELRSSIARDYRDVSNPYGNGNASKEIVKQLKISCLQSSKVFFDLKVRKV